MPSRLEERIELPESKCPALLANLNSRNVGVIATHPWGPLGGNMHNNVVSAVVLYFQRLGVSTIRFDFGGSQIGRGYQQVEQVKEAARILGTKHVLLVGYSYGSLIAASASAAIPHCIGVVSIAPPWSVKHWLLCFNSNYHLEQGRRRRDLRRLMVIGSEDNFTKEAAFMKEVDTFPDETTTGALLKGADHFFRRREKDLMSIIGEWIINAYPEIQGNLNLFVQTDFSTALRQQQQRLVVKPSEEVADSACGDCGLGK